MNGKQIKSVKVGLFIIIIIVALLNVLVIGAIFNVYTSDSDNTADSSEVAETNTENALFLNGAGKEVENNAPSNNSVIVLRGKLGGGSSSSGVGGSSNSNGPVCGNNIHEESEECDDGNLENNDGCNKHCMIENSGGESRGVGSPDTECQNNGFDFGIAKYQCSSETAEPGSAYDNYTITVNWTGSGDDCSSVDWTSDPAVDGVLSKEGGDTFVKPGGTSGTINQGTHGISHITFCGNETQAFCGDGNLDEGEECDDGNNEDGDGCSATCTIEECGNGIKDPGEECDDGNDDNFDECRNDCTLPDCGDGIIDEGEECDDGELNGEVCEPPYNGSCTYCTEICQNETLYDGYCGDGIINGPEECDDGNDDNEDSCRNDCTLPYCGDGIIDEGEECDCGEDGEEGDGGQIGDPPEGPGIPGEPGEIPDFCGCEPEVCKNETNKLFTIVQCLDCLCNYSQPECEEGKCGAECDEDSDCEDNSCEETYYDYCEGNKLADYNGNKINDSVFINDSCTNTCDIIDSCACSDCEPDCYAEPVIQCVEGQCDAQCDSDDDCDDYNENTIDSCNAECGCENEYVPSCGNGVLDAGEECDDGNNEDGDGCSATCTIEECGNGIKDPGEECDDGNDDNFDECRNDCTLPDCGDGIIDEGEECDDGENNGQECTPPYNGSCTYCTEICEEETLYDGYCGDGIINGPEECEYDIDCDDYNASTIDTCTACSCEHLYIPCFDDDDCGEDGYLEDPFCVCTTNVWDWWITYECVNPGQTNSYCTNSTEMQLKQECGNDECGPWNDVCYNNDVYEERTCYDRGCKSGECFDNEYTDREKIQECYSDYCDSYWEYYCVEDDVWRNRTCYERGCKAAECYINPYEDEELYEECEDTCADGRCQDVECYNDLECPDDTWMGNEFCWCGKLFDYYIDYFCVEDGTVDSYCDSSTTLMVKNDTCNELLTEVTLTDEC